jgi:hypothetical protein
MNKKSNAGRKKLGEDKLLSKKIFVAFTEKEFEDLKQRMTTEDEILKTESSSKKRSKCLQPFEHVKSTYKNATTSGKLRVYIDEIGLCSNSEIAELNKAGRILNQVIRKIYEGKFSPETVRKELKGLNNAYAEAEYIISMIHNRITNNKNNNKEDIQ